MKITSLLTSEDFEATVQIMGKVTAKIHARADVNTENELFNHESEEEILNAIGQDF